MSRVGKIKFQENVSGRLSLSFTSFFFRKMHFISTAFPYAILQWHFFSSLQCAEYLHSTASVSCPAEGDLIELRWEECPKFCVSYLLGDEWANCFILLKDVVWADFFQQDLNLEVSVSACNVVRASYRHGGNFAAWAVVLPWSRANSFGHSVVIS